MSDAKLKKKVQLKQKTETPVVQLKRKGEAADAVHLKKKTDSEAAVVAAAVAATAATAAEKGATAEAASAAEAKKTGATQGQFKKADAGTAATAGSVNSNRGVSGSTTTGAKSVSGKVATGTSTASEKGKGGKVLGWILGAAALAGLVFGGYKLIDNNKGDKSLLADGEAVVESAEEGNSAADEGVAKVQNNQSASENTEGGGTEGTASNASENAVEATPNGANGSEGSASSANANSTSGTSGSQDDVSGSKQTSTQDSNGASSVNGSAKSAGSNATTSAGQGNEAAGKTAATTSTASSKAAATTTTAAAGKSGAGSSSTSAAEINGVSVAPAFTVNKISDTKAECLFEFDSSVVTENSTLNEIAEIARKSGKTVTISGYTDKIGTDEYNQRLSDRRANAIRAYLVKRGVSSDKINATGYGVCKIYSTNAENRRADIILD